MKEMILEFCFKRINQAHIFVGLKRVTVQYVGLLLTIGPFDFTVIDLQPQRILEHLTRELQLL